MGPMLFLPPRQQHQALKAENLKLILSDQLTINNSGFKYDYCTLNVGSTCGQHLLSEPFELNKLVLHVATELKDCSGWWTITHVYDARYSDLLLQTTKWKLYPVLIDTNSGHSIVLFKKRHCPSMLMSCQKAESVELVCGNKRAISLCSLRRYRSQ